jgi:hypothetical protein
MTPEQRAALGDVVVTQINGTIANVHTPFEGELDGVAHKFPAFKELANEFDILAIVAPIGLESQVLSIAGDKPVIRAENARILVASPDGGESKVAFEFRGWKRLLKIEVLMEDFLP